MAYVAFATRNVPLDPSYKNPIRFEVATNPLAGQTTVPLVRDRFMTDYFRNYANTASIYKSYTNYNEVNFDYGDGINCVLNYDLSKLLASPQTQYDQVLNLALNSNYLHMRPTPSGGTVEDRFYFIRSARQLNANVVQFVLELDILTTYPEINIQGGLFLERNHANRFVNKGTGGSPRFFFGDDALVSDTLDSVYDATIPALKKEFKVQYVNPEQENATEINDYLNSTEWVYFWYAVSPDGSPSFASRVRIIETLPATFNDFLGDDINETGYNYGLYCIVCPMKAIETVYRPATYPVDPDVVSLWELGQIYDNKFGQNALVGITISPFAPFTTHANGGNLWSKMTWNATEGKPSMFFDRDTPTVNQAAATGGAFLWWDNIPETYFWRSAAGAFEFEAILRYKLRGELFTMTDNLDFTTDLSLNMPYLTASPAYNTTRQKAYEPKLFQQPYRKLAIKNVYSPDPQFYSYTGFDARIVDLKIMTAPNPIQEKLDVYLITNEPLWVENNIYANQPTARMNLTTQNIYNMPIGQDPWKDYLQSRGAQAALTTVASVGAIAITGGMTGIGGFGALALVNELGTALQATQSPDSARVQGGDLAQDYMLDLNLKPFALDLTLTTPEQDKVWDYYTFYGYQINENRLFDTSSAGCFRRWRFNFVQANDNSLSEKLSSADGRTMSINIRNKIKEILNAGTTFWNYYGQSGTAARQTTITLWNSEIHDRTQYENLERVFFSSTYPQ